MSESMKQTILEQFDVPGSSYETVMMLVEIPPGVNSGLHTHPGFDAAYLLDGDLMVLERDSRRSRSIPASLGTCVQALCTR